MNDLRLMQTLMDLCRIPSPSGQEGRAAAYVRARAAALGLEVEEDGAGGTLGSDTGNLLVRVPGRGEPVFFCAHLDTVPVPAELAEIPLIREGDRLHTGGASILGYDDKGGVAAMLELAEIAAERKGETLPLELVFTIQEERGLRGSGVFRHRPPAGAQRLCAGLRSGSGQRALRPAQPRSTSPSKCAARRPTPPWPRSRASTPSRRWAPIINALPTGKIDDETVMNLAKVEGGGAANVVPDRAVLTGELRSLDEDKLQELMARVQQAAEQQAAAFGASASLAFETSYTLYRVAPDWRSAQLFEAACRAEGLQPRFEQTLGGSDANNFNQKGLACLNIGLEMNNIHSSDEFMRPSQFVRAARLLERIINA